MQLEWWSTVSCSAKVLSRAQLGGNWVREDKMITFSTICSSNLKFLAPDDLKIWNYTLDDVYPSVLGCKSAKSSFNLQRKYLLIIIVWQARSCRIWLADHRIEGNRPWLAHFLNSKYSGYVIRGMDSKGLHLKLPDPIELNEKWLSFPEKN